MQLMDLCQKIIDGKLRLTKKQLALYVTNTDDLHHLMQMGAGRFAWHIVHGTWNEPTCQRCGNAVQYQNHRRNYAGYCSRSCAYADPTRQVKISATMMDRYGVNNAAHSAQLTEKKKQTLLEKLGVDHPSKSADVKLKKKQTMQARWGVENPSQSVEIQQRKIETNNQRWGVDWAAQSQQVRELIVKTNMERYGNASSLGNADVRDRATQTMLDRYGKENPQQVPEIQERTRKTNLEKYGCQYPNQNVEVRQRIAETNMQRYGSLRWWSSTEGKTALEQIHLQTRGVTNPAKDPDVIKKIRATVLDRYGVVHPNYINMDANTIAALSDPDLFRMMVTGRTVKEIADILTVDESTIYRISRNLGCRDLMDLRYNSYEKKVTDLLDTIGVRYICHDRQTIAPKELDIYIPDYKIAIEVGSIYWHSEQFGKKHDYHFKKWKACDNLGITLFQWFDDDLGTNWHLTSSRLMRALGIKSPVVGARKVQLGACTPKEERLFLDAWHVKGYTNARNHVVAARYNDEIIAIMSIKTKENEAVIERWATDITRSWPGLFSRCIKHWLQQTGFTGIVKSWCDNRLGDGKVYLNSGFIKQKTSKPGYWYFRNNGLENRQRYQKHKLKKLFGLDDQDDQKSEFEIMRLQGYDRFWDAGHTLWIKHI